MFAMLYGICKKYCEPIISSYFDLLKISISPLPQLCSQSCLCTKIIHSSLIYILYDPYVSEMNDVFERLIK